MSRQLLRCISDLRLPLTSPRRLVSLTACVLQQPLKKLDDPSELDRVRDRVSAIVGSHGVAVSEAVRSQHGQDEGPEKGRMPDVVAFPTGVEQVSEAGS